MAELNVDDFKELLLRNFLLAKENAELQTALGKATQPRQGYPLRDTLGEDGGTVTAQGEAV